MRFPGPLSILMAVTLGACGQPLTHDMTGTGGTGAGGDIETGGSGAICNSGACGCSVTGQQLCGGSCVEVTSDSNNCGSCGYACATGQSCSNGSCTATVLGCPMSDPPATSTIATFTSDGGIAPMFGLFTYGSAPQPTYTIAAGVLNVVNTIATSAASNYYQGFGIYFNGNAVGTDCVDASSYTGIAFSLSGSLAGAGCAMQFSINDSEHTQPLTGDPKAAGPLGSYGPQLAISSAELAVTPVTIMVPFVGTGAPVGGSPPIPIDPRKLTSVQWQMSTPVAGDGGATECVWNVNVSDVSFYR